ncbi:hypothetical protein Lal_00045850 [Lupinus albus]|uniref:Putative nucleotide-diphospho-sugar transferase n=1 Tax=Lupinus albus TaxID=3870 RepID=A0A6A4PFB7_LUPAL|nr:putative nucleotide-diphospho-sugar transferase [Lupinus albus]KAF1886617.1 hypothetical protein Lal_00045850 [Lupinus albus]
MKEPATTGDVENGGSKPLNSGGSGSSNHLLVKRVIKVTAFFVGITVLWMFLYNSATPFGFPSISQHFIGVFANEIIDPKLEIVLKNASMVDKTVIITTLNDAWAEPGSIFDLFLESFHKGNETEKLLKHLVVITLDQKAYARCIVLHPYCYQLETKGDNFTNEAFFMTPDYLHMMWRRIKFLGSVLQLGYNFVFTDADIMWFRDPFKEFYKDADFQIACDFFNGNSYDLNNMPNGGFTYVKSSMKTIWFYRFWYASKDAYPKMHDQDVLNKIKKNYLIAIMKLKIRFLSTEYFGGFCEPSKDFNKVSTMHANCCVGLDNKVIDLKILLEDWRKYMALPDKEKQQLKFSWRAPQTCRTSFERSKGRMKNGRRL